MIAIGHFVYLFSTIFAGEVFLPWEIRFHGNAMEILPEPPLALHVSPEFRIQVTISFCKPDP